MTKPLISIIMGSDSDLPIMQEAVQTLEQFGLLYEINIVSAHRTPNWMFTYAKNAHKNGLKVIIAGAGGSAHLPGMVAAITSLPVIGVPIKSKSLDGLDSLLSIVQMPPGIPVATVAINGAKNAALLALKIIGLNDKKIEKKIIDFSGNLKKTVIAKNKKLNQFGIKKYLKIFKKI